MSACSRKDFQKRNSVYSDDDEGSKSISSPLKKEDSASDSTYDDSSSRLRSSSKGKTIVFRDKTSSRYIYNVHHLNNLTSL